MRIVILYASEHGQTEAVAGALALHLGRAGHEVAVLDSRLCEPDPHDHDVVLIGTRIHVGRPARRIRRYVQRHHSALNAMPSGYFTVSMSAAAGHDRGGADACLQRILHETGWHPNWTATVGGGLPYRRYGRFMRWMMRRIAAAMHAPVDTTRNHDLTDWDEVARFAAQIAADVAARAPAVAPRPALASDVVTDR